jgi:hypothetical protein
VWESRRHTPPFVVIHTSYAVFHRPSPTYLLCSLLLDAGRLPSGVCVNIFHSVYYTGYILL